jgi:hypothetical protein
MTLARAICRLEEVVVVVTGGDYTTGKMGIGVCHEAWRMMS